MIGNSQEIIQYLWNQDRGTIFEVKPYKPPKNKRSLNANSYCWVLLQKLADKLNTTKEELYRYYIKNKGIFRTITIDNQAVNTFIHLWEEKGLGWICEVLKEDEKTTDLIAYYGTSSYNTSQMAHFIDYVVEEAKLQNIEVLTPQEIESLKENWK